jgi:hypothetical protein
MKQSLILQPLIFLFLSILVACAAPQEEPDGLDHDRSARRSDCISQMSIRDYQVLDDANLIVTGSGKRKYHVSLVHRAFGLRSTWRIGFHTTTGRVCAGFSDLVLDDGMGVERIKVRSIRELTEEEHEELLVRFGKKKPEVDQTPEPAEVEGAEVEELD